MNQTDCIFCQIINRQIQAEIVYENEAVLAFLDIKPNSYGHTLLIPKNHHQDLFELPDETITSLYLTAKKLAQTIKQKLGAEGINLNMNNGKTAGQIIFHAHLHIIPRYEATDPKNHTKKPAQELLNIKV